MKKPIFGAQNIPFMISNRHIYYTLVEIGIEIYNLWVFQQKNEQKQF